MTDSQRIGAGWVWWATYAVQRQAGDGVLSSWIAAGVSHAMVHGYASSNLALREVAS
jgi:hypothetical protein